MNRTQISTSVSEETRRQADELIDNCGYSMRDVLTIAIELLYSQKITAQQEANIMTYQDYSIKIEWSEDGIWGPEGTDSYDVDASLDNLAALLRERIEAEYPGAELDINLTSINDRVQVIGTDVATEDDIRAVVTELGSRVWGEFDWAVEA